MSHGEVVDIQGVVQLASARIRHGKNSSRDIWAVWQALLEYLEKSYVDRRALKLPSFGTFTFGNFPGEATDRQTAQQPARFLTPRTYGSHDKQVTREAFGEDKWPGLFSFDRRFVHEYNVRFEEKKARGNVPMQEMSFLRLASGARLDKQRVRELYDSLIEELGLLVMKGTRLCVDFGVAHLLVDSKRRARVVYGKEGVDQASRIMRQSPAPVAKAGHGPGHVAGTDEHTSARAPAVGAGFRSLLLLLRAFRSIDRAGEDTLSQRNLHRAAEALGLEKPLAFADRLIRNLGKNKAVVDLLSFIEFFKPSGDWTRLPEFDPVKTFGEYIHTDAIAPALPSIVESRLHRVLRLDFMRAVRLMGIPVTEIEAQGLANKSIAGKNLGHVDVQHLLSRYVREQGEVTGGVKNEDRSSLGKSLAVEHIRTTMHNNRRALQQAFVKADRSGDGRLSRSEFRRCMQSMNLGLSADQIDMLLAAADTDADGYVNHKEFIGLFRDDTGLAEDEGDAFLQVHDALYRKKRTVKDFFRKCDPRATGSVPMERFAKGLAYLGVDLDPKMIHRLFVRADSNRNGTLEYEEFVTAFSEPPLKGDWEEEAFDKVRRHLKAKKTPLRECWFSAFNPSGAEYTPLQDFRSGLLEHGVKTSLKNTTRLYELCDANKDGRVDYHDFRTRFGHSDDSTREKLFSVLRAQAYQQGISLRDMFRAWDTNNSGNLSLQELQNGLNAVRKDLGIDRAFIKNLMMHLDTDGNGQVDMEEWLTQIGADSASSTHPTKPPPSVDEAINHIRGIMARKYASLKDAFASLDRDNDGVLSLQEFREGVIRLGADLSLPVVDSVYRLCDKYGNGVVGYGDFQRRFETMVEVPWDESRHVWSKLRMFVGKYSPEILFKEYDKDRDGLLSVKEFYALLLAAGVKVSREFLQELFTSADLNHDGFIDATEFQKILVETAEVAHQTTTGKLFGTILQSGAVTATRVARQLRDLIWDEKSTALEAFAELDTNRDGFISFNELLRAICRLYPGIPPKELKKLMVEADVNNDGMVSYPEFLHFLAEKAQPQDWEEEVIARIQQYVRKFAGGSAKKLFQVMDADGDKRLNEKDMRAFLNGTLGLELSHSQINQFMRYLAPKSTPYVTLNEAEFVNRFKSYCTFSYDDNLSMMDCKRLVSEYFVKNFISEEDIMSRCTNGNGQYLSAANFLAVLRPLIRVHKLSPDSLARVFTELDADQDNRLSVDDISKLVNGTLVGGGWKDLTIRLVRDMMYVNGISILQAYRHFDIDKDGVVSRDDFHKALIKLDPSLQKHQTSQLMNDAVKKSRVMEFKEFKSLFADKINDIDWESNTVEKISRSVKDVSSGRSSMDAFRHFDKNGDGTISNDELQAALDSLCVILSKREIDTILRHHRGNCNGSVDYAKFCQMFDLVSPAAVAKQRESRRFQRLCDAIGDRFITPVVAWMIFDQDCNGTLSKKEFHEGLSKLGLMVSKEQADSLFNVIDLKKDGYIDKAEFLKVITVEHVQGTLTEHQKLTMSLTIKDGVLIKLLTDFNKHRNLLRDEFKRIDKVRKGTLARNDFIKCLSKAKGGIDIKDLHRIVRTCELQQDGEHVYGWFMDRCRDVTVAVSRR